MRTYTALIAGLTLVLAGCALQGQSSAELENFVGEWVLDQAVGSTPPEGFSTVMESAGDRLILRSSWHGAKTGPHGLTLIGVVTPELSLDTAGRDVKAHIGLMVLQHTTRFERGRLRTDWSTSDFLGSSFSGTWTRSLLDDGAKLSLQIDAVSSTGEISRALLTFRRKAV